MNALVKFADVPLAPQEMKVIVGELARAKSRQDVDAAMEIYHPEGVLLSPPLCSAAEGGEALRKSVEAFFRFAPDYSVDLSGQAVDGDTLCAWGEICFTPAFAFNGQSPNGAQVRTPVFILFRFRQRKVVWESFHFDLADVAHQVGLPTEAFQRT